MLMYGGTKPNQRIQAAYAAPMTPTSAPAQILGLDWAMTAPAAGRLLATKGWQPLLTQCIPQGAGQTCSTTGRFLEWSANAYLIFDRCGPGSGLDEVLLVIRGSDGERGPTVLDILRELHLRFSRKYDQFSWDEFAQLKDAGFIPEPYRCYHWYEAKATGGTDILLAVIGAGSADGEPHVTVSYRSSAWAQAQCTFSDSQAVASAVITAAARIMPPTAAVVTHVASDGTWMGTIVTDQVVDNPATIVDTAYRIAARRIHVSLRPVAAGFADPGEQPRVNPMDELFENDGEPGGADRIDPAA